MEQRRFQRLVKALKVSYTVIAEIDSTPFEFGNSELVDISKMGLAMLVDEPVPQRLLLQLQLHFGDRPSGLIVLGKTIYCKPLEQIGMYRVGVQFVGIVQPNLEDILEELEKAMNASWS